MLELINQLTSQLGVNNDQAQSGAGAIFKAVQQNLSGDDFGKLTGALPGLADLIGKAPATNTAGGGLASMAGSALSAFGGGDSALGKMAGLAQVAGQFKSLGLNADMVTKFLPIVMSFAQSQGGDMAKNLLEKVLKK